MSHQKETLKETLKGDIKMRHEKDTLNGDIKRRH